ncbi:hypothetical protein IFM89_020478 [Coptis chinensis]|uniref:Protein NIM1-INTERACTING 2 n=1 Tax=Coptis chinensis TaxID=261450 RepID=A0A835LHZ7_9MAGN|nr:hypothetical protein IFM89_020478 [Coptis chinensis]
MDSTESEKRKREGEINERKTKKRGDNGGQETTTSTSSSTATEAEVEEFFAIIRRFHSAVRYFKKENDKGKGKLTEKSASWKPDFVVRELEECNGVMKNKGKKEERVEENGGLDLNLDPESDPNSG